MSDEVLITKIQKFSVNDGPGFRTNVFLKGCNMRCIWCHNPETQSFSKEIYWKRLVCVQCGRCLDVCPRGAINPPIPPEEAQADDSTYYKINLEKCDMCLKCAEACPYGGLEIVGQPMTVEQILDEVEQDRPFYDNSGGGLTISGGEPTVHPEFVHKLIDGAKERALHVCLDTNGHCKWDIFEPLVEKVDIVLYDLKHLDPEKHKEITGVDNALVLENLKRLSEKGTDVWLRIVVTPGFSDTFEYHKEVINFLKNLPRPLSRIDLLPFHNWCEDKYRWLGREWPMGDMEALKASDVEPLKDLYLSEGISNVTVGGSGFEGNDYL